MLGSFFLLFLHSRLLLQLQFTRPGFVACNLISDKLEDLCELIEKDDKQFPTQSCKCMASSGCYFPRGSTCIPHRKLINLTGNFDKTRILDVKLKNNAIFT